MRSMDMLISASHEEEIFHQLAVSKVRFSNSYILIFHWLGTMRSEVDYHAAHALADITRIPDGEMCIVQLASLWKENARSFCPSLSFPNSHIKQSTNLNYIHIFKKKNKKKEKLY